MTSAWHFMRLNRLFSARNRRPATPIGRAVRFQPGFEAVEDRTLLSTITFQPSNGPASLFVGNFDGQSDLLAVNTVSSELTLTSGFNGPAPVSTTISSGGTGSQTAFTFSTQTGFDDVVVGNTGNGVLALFEGTSQGLTLESSVTVPNLPHPTALVLAAVSDDAVEFYVVTEGQAKPELVTLSLSGNTPLAGQSTPHSQTSSGVAQLVPLQESSLALVATLLPLSIDSSSGPPPGAGASQAVTAIALSSATPVSFGQSLTSLGGRFGPAGAGNEQPPVILGNQAARLGNPSAPAWQRYTLGTNDALEQFDREHPELSRGSSDLAPGTSSGNGQNEGERAPGAGDVLTQTPLSTPRQVAIAAAADEVIDVLSGDDPLVESRRWWREDATVGTEFRLAGTRSHLSACLVLTSVVAGYLYFGPARQRARANGRLTGARRWHRR